MPLDARKVAHIIANRVLIRAFRTTQVAVVYRSQYGGVTAASWGIILKAQGSSQPQAEDQTSRFTNEYLAEFPLELDPSTVQYVALTAGGAVDDVSLAAARIKLEIVEYRISGLVADRWQCTLRRFR